MLYHAKNGSLTFPDSTMDYIRFGTGSRVLVMLPGLGDGLRTTKGTALPMAVMYRMFARDFTVYAFSRKTLLPEGCTTRDMARDLNTALEMLDIEKADLFGVSMGGMIAQHFAADYPQKTGKLILAVTCPEKNAIMEAAISQWLQCADQNDHTALMDSNLRLIYSQSYYQRNRWMIPFIGKLTKPRSYDRFRIQAMACLTHSSRHRLAQIQAETLVIGGGQDQVLGCQPSRDIAAGIPQAALKLYPDWGHGVYEEAPDFNETVLRFLTEDTASEV